MSRYSKRKNEYRKYLNSYKWKKKRAKILKRFNYTCAKCGAKRVRFNVHHLTYKHIFHERNYELILLCESCHTAIHKTMKQNKSSTLIKSLLSANKINVKLVQFVLSQID